jgi:hypothetical protein
MAAGAVGFPPAAQHGTCAIDHLPRVDSLLFSLHVQTSMTWIRVACSVKIKHMLTESCKENNGAQEPLDRQLENLNRMVIESNKP